MASKRKALSGHQSARAESVEWLTPPEIIRALGSFELDPCAPIRRPWNTAKRHFTILDDGLSQPWAGRVWLNPPFGREATRWIERLSAHGNGIALLPARTETRMYYAHVWGQADSICFVRGRPHFCRPDGTRAKANSGAPIALIAYGYRNTVALVKANLGVVLSLVNC